MPLDTWTLTIGVVVAPFGIRGEVRVRLETDFPDRFLALKKACLRPQQGEARLVEITGCRFHKGYALLRVREVETMSQAELLRGSLLQVREADAVALPRNEFYLHDLKGCDVVTCAGRRLGQLTEVLRGRANDVYVVRDGGQEILLPAVSQVITSVDLQSRRIVVSPTPGLLPDDPAQDERPP